MRADNTTPASGGPPAGVDRVLRGPAGYIAVFLVALVVRLFYLSQISQNPFFDHPILDAHVYDGYAVKIAAGEPPVSTPYFHPPLYPYFLGALYKVFGREFVFVRLAHCVLGVANALLTLLLAFQLVRPKAAFACGMAAALYGTMIFYESELLAPVLIVFFNLLIALSALSFLRRPRLVSAAACGVFVGLSAITMPIVLPFGLVLPFCALIGARRLGAEMGWRRMLLCGVVYAAGLAAVVAPVTMRNARHGDAVLIAYNGGVNMFLGTGSDYDEKVDSRPGPVWDDRLSEPIRAGKTKPSAQSAYFVGKALAIIEEDPVAYAGLLCKKLWLFFRGNEIMRNQEIYPFRQYSPVLSVLLWKKGVAFPAGILLPMALIGTALAVSKRRWGLGVLVAFVACHVAALMLFFITARYRVSVVPFLIVLAGHAAQELVAGCRDRRWRFVGVTASSFALLVVASNAGSGSMPELFNSDAYYNLAVAYRAEGRDGARALFAKAVEADPDNIDARIHLGSYRDLDGDPEAAIREYELVLRRHPENTDAAYNKAAALLHLGDVDAAKAQLRRVLEIDPEHRPAREALERLERDR